jgi:hypothetical protein
LSKRPNTRGRIERRAERQARMPSATPTPRRVRNTRPVARRASGGFFDRLPTTQLAIAGAGVLIVLFLAYAVMQANKDPDTGPVDWQKAQANSDAKIPGQYIAPHPGKDGQLCEVATCIPSMDDRLHVVEVIPICTSEQLAAGKISDPLCYNSNPPTSGPHNGSPMPFKVLDNPAPKESLIHNMEHGGVVVWYNTDDQNLIKQLADAVNAELDRRRLVVMTRYTEMEPNTIALTSWTRLDKFKTDEYSKKRVTDFIEENSKRFNPEGF